MRLLLYERFRMIPGILCHTQSLMTIAVIPEENTPVSFLRRIVFEVRHRNARASGGRNAGGYEDPIV